MCGIVGYIGNEQASDILLKSLQRLEYRGYDSAGIATVSDGELHLIRSVGKLNNLAALLEDRAQPGYCLLYTSPSPRDRTRSRMPSSA